MKTRSKIFSKSILFVLMAALTLAFCIPVAATSSTTLTTTVPETLPLLLELTGNGTIRINGIEHTQSGVIEVSRNSTIELQIIPDTGHYIKTVVYNGHDYTKESKRGTLTLPVIPVNVQLCVHFSKIPSVPQTGDPYPPLHLVVLMLFSLIGMIITLWFWKKKETHL